MKPLLIVLTLALGLVGLAAMLGPDSSWVGWILVALAIGGMYGAMVLDRIPAAMTSFAGTLATGSVAVGVFGAVTRAPGWICTLAIVLGVMLAALAVASRAVLHPPGGGRDAAHA